MHDAGASWDYRDQGQLAHSGAQQVGLQGKYRMLLRTGDQDIDGMGPIR
jgi:hypothetical protein